MPNLQYNGTKHLNKFWEVTCVEAMITSIPRGATNGNDTIFHKAGSPATSPSPYYYIVMRDGPCDAFYH